MYWLTRSFIEVSPRNPGAREVEGEGRVGVAGARSRIAGEIHRVVAGIRGSVSRFTYTSTSRGGTAERTRRSQAAARRETMGKCARPRA